MSVIRYECVRRDWFLYIQIVILIKGFRRSITYKLINDGKKGYSLIGREDEHKELI